MTSKGSPMEKEYGDKIQAIEAKESK